MLAACFVAVTAISWRYLFRIPIVTALVIASCLLAAAWAAEHLGVAGDQEKGVSRRP